MERHEWLTRELATLPFYARHLLAAVSDPRLPASGRNPCFAAAKYLVEWEDIIPDTDPVFGYVDDLFVVLYGLSELVKFGGREGKLYGEKALPGGGRVADRIQEAKENFGGFWTYIVKEVGPGFQEIARALQEDPGLLAPLVAEVRTYVQSASQRAVVPIEPQALELFLVHRSARRP
jgi:uncharacterized membrane protein YkvA (DUF1232 family)